MIYQSTSYWLASSCSYATFVGDCAYFCMNDVSSTLIGSTDMYTPFVGSCFGSAAIRPVVELADDIQVSYANGVVTLSK